MALAVILDRYPVLHAMDMADLGKPDRVRRIESSVMVDIALREMRRDADLVSKANLTCRAH